jgi:hypothetical protein
VEKPRAHLLDARFRLSESIPYPIVDRICRAVATLLPECLNLTGRCLDQAISLLDFSISNDYRPLNLRAFVINLIFDDDSRRRERYRLARDLFCLPRLV